MNRRILIIEDDKPLAEVLSHNLRHVGFEIKSVMDGNAALAAVRTFTPDLVLLDLTLPGKDGLHWCTAWREHSQVPIIMLTARNRKEDKLKGLMSGADDYVTKPFDLDELLARIHAVLRRTRPKLESLTLGPAVIDFVNYRATRNGEPVEMTRREFDVLRYLAERSSAIVRRDELLANIWGFTNDPFTRSVDKTIVRLRKKLEVDPHHPTFIQTAHGDGYYLIVEK